MGLAMGIKCKRIIDGKTFNTETATQIEGWEEDHGHYASAVYLYQNRFGAFFLYTNVDGRGEDDGEQIDPYTPEQARQWLEEHRGCRTDLIESLFGSIPEAGSGEAKYTLRLPDSLRVRLAACAKAKNQSLNAWIVRCLEHCAEVAMSQDRDMPPMGHGREKSYGVADKGA